MKHYISEEEKKKQIEQMWEDYEKANKANQKPTQDTSFKNDLGDYFDEDEEVCTDEPVRYEKLSEGKNPRQKFKKKGEYTAYKKSNSFNE